MKKICIDCGKENLEESNYCNGCGAYIDYNDKNEFEEDIPYNCVECGTENPEDSTYCTKCGNSLKKDVNKKEIVSEEIIKKDSKNKWIASALAFFLGCLGFHHFYLGNIARGVICICLLLTSFLSLPFIILVIENLICCIQYLSCRKDIFTDKYSKN